VTDSGFDEGSLLIVAFEGWNDAGEAASGAARAVAEQLGLAPKHEFDAERYVDYQFSRPTVSHDESGDRVIEWPGITLYGPIDGGPGIHVLLGTEPARSWRTFGEEVVDVLLAADITGIVFLGSMLADVPHTRPIAIGVSSENRALREEFDLERSGYEGPVGILSVLAMEAERVGIPGMSIWASVPHYVHNAPSPKAQLALVERLEDFVPITLERGSLVEDAAAWESGIDALAGDDDDMAAYIEQLERARDTVDSPEASGEAIAQEFERYLRRRDGKAGDDRSGGA